MKLQSRGKKKKMARKNMILNVLQIYEEHHEHNDNGMKINSKIFPLGDFNSRIGSNVISGIMQWFIEEPVNENRDMPNADINMCSY